MTDGPAAEPPSPLRFRDFRLFWVARFCAVLATQAQGAAVAWQVYELARERGGVAEAAFLVGLVGLAQFLPLFALALPAGEVADRRNRRVILQLCIGAELVCAAALAVSVFLNGGSLTVIFTALVLFGAARAFLGPAATALGPMLVPAASLPRAVALNSLSFQTGSILGPAVGGLLCAISPAAAYGTAGALFAVSVVLLGLIRSHTTPAAQAAISRLAAIREGLAYVWREKIVLGAISLDLFAVLLGGATALLPVFARDILQVGPEGFGVLRAAPAVGAVITAAILARRPLKRFAGRWMFGGVAVFGLATIAFGLSTWWPLSLAALAVLGAADMVSVFIRQTLVQVTTPDAMRGRVGAVSQLFISASNELGEFESGVVARFLGPVGAAVFGGVGALGVTGLWAWMFPELRKADRLG